MEPLWQSPTSGSKSCNSSLTLMVDHGAATNATVSALGEGQEASYFAGEHRFTSSVVTACRREDKWHCPCLCPFPAHTPSWGSTYAAAQTLHGPHPEWAQRCAVAAWPAAAPGSTECRWAGCAPAQTGGPVGRTGHQRLQRGMAGGYSGSSGHHLLAVIGEP